MFLIRNLRRLAVSLFIAIVPLVCAGAAIGQDADIWKDDATGLTWAVKDSGMAITPNEGHSYCANLKAGGLSGWRLPEIDELEAIYDSKQKKSYKSKGTIELSDACVLSSSTNRSGDIWTFCFNSGSRNLGGGGGCGTTALALCVNGPAK